MAFTFVVQRVFIITFACANVCGVGILASREVCKSRSAEHGSPVLRGFAKAHRWKLAERSGTVAHTELGIGTHKYHHNNQMARPHYEGNGGMWWDITERRGLD